MDNFFKSNYLKYSTDYLQQLIKMQPCEKSTIGLIYRFSYVHFLFFDEKVQALQVDEKSGIYILFVTMMKLFEIKFFTAAYAP